MTILTDREKVELRNAVERLARRKQVPVAWLKDQIGDAFQAIEDRWEAPGTQTALANDIEAAAPGVFSTAQKRYLAAIWLIHKGRREEASI